MGKVKTLDHEVEEAEKDIVLRDRSLIIGKHYSPSSVM